MKKGKKEERGFKRYRDENKPSDAKPAKFDREKSERGERKFEKKQDEKQSFKRPRKTFTKDNKPFDKERKPVDKDRKRFDKKERPYFKESGDGKSLNHSSENEKKSYNRERKPSYRKDHNPRFKRPKPEREGESNTSNSGDNNIRLNKYIANAGICSRREADELIASGVVSVNGKVVTEMGFKIGPTDVVNFGGQTLRKEKMVYIILNKPKDFITTLDDEQKRKTVMELLAGACKERIYPVGRLDRNTTGLLLFTNDGELTKKLTHPRYGIKKLYAVELDKPLSHQHLAQIKEGLELEDGRIEVDEVDFATGDRNHKEVGIQLHSGRNRIVRRIFEHLGYNVRKLDRVMFGPLTKKDLPRGRWRHLTQAEIGMLKMIKSAKE